MSLTAAVHISASTVDITSSGGECDVTKPGYVTKSMRPTHGSATSRHMVRRESRSSRIGADRIIAPPKEENTYKTEPDTFFSIEKAKAVVTRVLKESLAGVQYDENKAGRLTRILADKVKDAIKKLTYGQRYKIVTSVSVGQKKLSSITAASQCIWNDSFDRRVDVKYDNGDIFAMVLAFVLYVE